MNCQICGKPSGYYPLCKECNVLKDKGEIIKCPECNSWHRSTESCKCNEIVQSCIVCEKPSGKNLLCSDCYSIQLSIRDEFDKNRSQDQFLTHYFNLKNSIFSINNLEYAKNACLRLISLSNLFNDLFKNSTLNNRVYEDVKYIIQKKTEFLNKISTPKESFNDKDFREQWPREHQCEDGHYVRSISEVVIDNWLYNHGIIHAYEKSVFMPSEEEAVVLSDFYLKDFNLYIEFWGISDDEKYKKRKEYKQKLYKDNNYICVDLEEKEVKRLDDILPRKLGKFAPKK